MIFQSLQQIPGIDPTIVNPARNPTMNPTMTMTGGQGQMPGLGQGGMARMFRQAMGGPSRMGQFSDFGGMRDRFDQMDGLNNRASMMGQRPEWFQGFGAR